MARKVFRLLLLVMILLVLFATWIAVWLTRWNPLAIAGALGATGVYAAVAYGVIRG